MRLPAILAGVLERPVVARVLVTLGVAQVAIFAAGARAWSCPIRAVSGLPCPSCGLTHSLAALARGDLAGSVAYHPLGPVAAAALLALTVAAVAPSGLRDRLVVVVRAVEEKAALDLVLLVVLLAAWARALLGAVAVE
jgi:hypothetical protein